MCGDRRIFMRTKSAISRSAMRESLTLGDHALVFARRASPPLRAPVSIYQDAVRTAPSKLICTSPAWLPACSHDPMRAALIWVMPVSGSADDRWRLRFTHTVRGSRSAFCLAAVCPAGRPPGYGGDRRIGLVQRLRCPGRRITALCDQRQAMHERPGQRQGDGQQQPHPQAPGEKCPHAQGPFVVPARFPALPAFPQAKHLPSRLLLHYWAATSGARAGRSVAR
jgi:hypothetical protein